MQSIERRTIRCRIASCKHSMDVKTLPTTFLVLLALIASACDRPFTDVGEATVEVVSPDLSYAFDDDSITLELRVTSVRDVTRVSAGDIDFASAGSDIWTAELDLQPGLNRLLVESVVDDGPTAVDTLDVLRIDWSVESLTASRPILFGSGGHTVSVLSDGSLALLGGSALPGGPGGFDLWTLLEGDTRFVPSQNQTLAPRIGHTATVLPDDRILILGGGVFGNIETGDALVEEVEIYDPAQDSFFEVPVVGAPIRRMYHTSVARTIGSQQFVVLLGGRGDTRYTPEPALGIRQDMRTFELRNDSLISLSPAVGPFIRFVAGHTQIALNGNLDDQASEFLVTGIDLEDGVKGVSVVMDFAAPSGIEISEWPSMRTPRIRHASAAISPGYVAHFGGRSTENDIPLDSGEIHVAAAAKSFLFPPALQASLTASYGGSATRLSDGRIVLIGGFDEAGNGLAVVDFVSLAVQ